MSICVSYRFKTVQHQWPETVGNIQMIFSLHKCGTIACLCIALVAVNFENECGSAS